ncbi:MAG: hypothetical protein HC880_22180, partial [Bacteroidia bacterium]|nr:hypothetical protein [Bacteroidia bacterium]
TYFLGYYTQYTALLGHGWEYKWRYDEPSDASGQTARVLALIPGAYALPGIRNPTPAPSPPPAPGNLLALRIVRTSLVGSLIFLKGDTGPQVYAGTGAVPDKESFEQLLIQALFDVGMPDPNKDPEGALQYLLNKMRGTGLEALSVQEQDLFQKLVLLIGFNSSNKMLIPSSEERKKGQYFDQGEFFLNTDFRGYFEIKEFYVELYIDHFRKIDPDGLNSLAVIDRTMVQMALDNQVPIIIMRFDNVINDALWENQNDWAQRYGYNNIKISYEVNGITIKW